jgi:hypothetical protein
MGTSSSYGGHKDTSHLLPSWARQSSDIDSNSTDTGIPPDDGQMVQDIPENSISDNQDTQVQNNKSQYQRKWRYAKNVMSYYASRGSEQRSPIEAGRAYIRAKGGAQKAAQSVISGKSTARNLANFFATTARSNISQGLNLIGLGHLIGKDVDTVFSGLIDALSDNGEDFDENIARQAIEDALTSFYEQCSENQNFESLEHLTPEQLKRAIENFVSGYIYKRWLQELGNCIERKAVSETEAVKLEVEVKIYVRDLVNLGLDSRNILSIDWNGDEGRQIIDSLYEDAYSLIEEG